MRGETEAICKMQEKINISIHSPHARGDVNCRQRVARHGLFQSTPLMRGETPLIGSEKVALKFQSTPLMRGETILRPELHAHDCISIHSPHARGDAPGVLLLRRFIKISIHSPHARGDVTEERSIQRIILFQSTPLMRGETIILSIHFFNF